MNKKIHCIINPQAANGNVQKLWPGLKAILERQLGPFSWDFTDKAGAAIPLALQALRQKPALLIVAGGDGTISEVVNGCMQSGLPKEKLPPIGICNGGSGGDFCRSLDIPKNLELAVDRIKNGQEYAIDVGHLEFYSLANEALERYFVNIAGFGMAGEVVATVAKQNSLKGLGNLGYFLASTRALVRYHRPIVSISLDRQAYQKHSVITQAICNGRFFGGAMQVAPTAALDDGFLQMVLIEDWNFWQALWHSRKLYKGSLTNSKGVVIKKAKEIHAKVEQSKGNRPVLIDCDGECVGTLPLRAKVIPQALRFLR